MDGNAISGAVGPAFNKPTASPRPQGERDDISIERPNQSIDKRFEGCLIDTDRRTGTVHG